MIQSLAYLEGYRFAGAVEGTFTGLAALYESMTEAVAAGSAWHTGAAAALEIRLTPVSIALAA